eukprot:s2963_g2.t1
MLDLHPEALAELIRNYAREAGVRELRKLIEKITRKVALSMVRVEEQARQKSLISTENLRKFVGQPPHSTDRLFHDAVPSGVAMGLAWTALGGKTLVVEARGRVPASNERMADADVSLEASPVPPDGNTPSSSSRAPAPAPRGSAGPRMKVTGKLGKVMGESSEIALTYAKIFLRELSPKNDFLDTAYIHMNMPEGFFVFLCQLRNQCEDGPSAGVTMTSALLSMALDRPVKRDLAMSGEVTLTGKVLRVGGIKERLGPRRKTLAAKRENVENLVLPMSNQADYLELKPYLRAGLTAHFVDHFDDVYRLAFEDGHLDGQLDTGAPVLEGSRGSEEMAPPPFMQQAATESPASAALYYDGDECEMNKFDEMMAFLAARDPKFCQVVAVDSDFGVFTRAWCMEGLIRTGARLRDLDVREMKASRVEDVELILAKIPDKDAFNASLQSLIFDHRSGLLAAWRDLDSSKQMGEAGRSSAVMGGLRTEKSERRPSVLDVSRFWFWRGVEVLGLLSASEAGSSAKGTGSGKRCIQALHSEHFGYKIWLL